MPRVKTTKQTVAKAEEAKQEEAPKKEAPKKEAIKIEDVVEVAELKAEDPKVEEPKPTFTLLDVGGKQGLQKICRDCGRNTSPHRKQCKFCGLQFI